MSQSDKDFMESRKELLNRLLSDYCRNVHGSEELCSGCKELFDYAVVRIHRCPNNVTRTPCSRCPCPCYSEEMRNRMKEVMDHSKPFFRKHPLIRFRYKFA
jgi:hypothetical protein